MDDQRRRTERLQLLNGLNDVELVVLNERWAGRTSFEIAGTLGINPNVARYHLANVYDKLGITYQPGGTALGRLMSFYELADDPAAPRIPHPDNLTSEELYSPEQPSGRALELVAEDDEALLAQRPGRDAMPYVEPREPRSPWPFIAAILAFALLVALALILIIGGRDGDDDELAPADATATQVTADLDASATALAEQALLSQQELDATATGLAVQATAEREAAAAAETEAANATASAQLPPTEIPTETPTEEPTPEPTPTEETPTAEPTAPGTATPTEPPPPTVTAGPGTPTPVLGEVIYEADWEAEPDEWELDENWQIVDGALVSSGEGRRELIAPMELIDFEALETADYAIEAVFSLVELEECDGVAGLLGRAELQELEEQEGDTFYTGYAGVACLDEWRILMIPDTGAEPEELESGELDPDDQPHTYRIEFEGQTVRFFMDGMFLGEADDDTYAEPGVVGFFLYDEVNVRVDAFRVLSLDEAPGAG